MHAGKLRDSCRFFLLAAALIAIPFAISMRVSESNYIKWLIFDLIVAATLVVALANVCFSKEVVVVKDRLHGAVLLWLLMTGVSVLLSRYSYASYDALWRVGMSAGIYITAVAAIKRERDMWVVLTLCAIVTLLVCLHVVMQLLGWDIVRYTNAPADRIFATFGNPNFLSGFLMLMFWLLAGAFLDVRSLLSRVLLGLLCGFVLYCLFWTKTKGAWIAFLVTALVMLLWFVSGWGFVYKMRRSVRIKAVCAIVLIFLGGVALFHKPIRERASTFGSSVAVRKVYWAGAVALIKERPVLGNGIGTFQIVYPEGRPRNFREGGGGWNLMHAHSEPLQILVEMGAVGFAFFCYLLWAFYSGILRSIRPESKTPLKGMQIGIMFGASALLLHNCIDVSMRKPTCQAFFWIFLGLSVAIRSLSCMSDEQRITFGWGRFPVFLRSVLFLGLIVLLGMLVKTHSIDAWRSEIYYRQGYDLKEHGRINAATSRTERAIALNPSSLRAYYQLGACYYDQKMYDEALHAYENLERRAPNFAQLQYNFATLYSLTGRWEEAVERFIRSDDAGIAPEDFSIAGMIAKFHASDADDEKYLAMLQKVVELRPNEPLVWNRLGIYWGARGDLSKAVEAFEKAVAVDNSYLPAQINLAKTYFDRKDYANVIETCKRILEIAPQSRDIRLNLARAYLLTGQRDKAKAEWDRAMQTPPSEPETSAYSESVERKRDSQ